MAVAHRALMQVPGHTLAQLTLLAALALPGCYGLHASPDPFGRDASPSADAGWSDAGTTSACGCGAQEVCVVACFSEQRCVPAPPRREGCTEARSGCFATDPCRSAPGFGPSLNSPLRHDGSVQCTCALEPGDTNCGAENCSDEQVCVEDCEAFGPRCAPRGPASCEDACGCFEVDPCASGQCAAVGPDGHVICECAPPAPSCESHLATGLGTTCDEATYGMCSRALEGSPCCTVFSRCEQGAIVDEVTCDDSCAQGCRVLGGPSDCRLGGCHWYEPAGCFGEDNPGVLTESRCVDRAQPCNPGDGTCEAIGRECVGLASDPCAGLPCDACLSVEFFCEQSL